MTTAKATTDRAEPRSGQAFLEEDDEDYEYKEYRHDSQGDNDEKRILSGGIFRAGGRSREPRSAAGLLTRPSFSSRPRIMLFLAIVNHLSSLSLGY